MKKRLLKIGIAILCILLFLYLVGYFHNPISIFNIDRVVLETYDHEGQSDDVRTGTVELNSVDIWALVTLYNLSRYDSNITAEPCCAEFRFYIYFHNGSKVTIREGSMTAAIVDPVKGDYYYAHSRLLLGWINLCIKKYGLGV